MTRTALVVATLFASVAFAGLAAAQPPPVQVRPPQTIGPNQAKPRHPRGLEIGRPRNARAVTATGCLRRERDVASRPDVIAAGAGKGRGFVLTGAKLSGPGVVAGGQDATAELYRVIGLEEDELHAHLEREVEVKGRLNLGRVSSPEDSDGRAGGDGDGRAAGNGGGSSDDEPKGLFAITASSIKTLASTCEAP